MANNNGNKFWIKFLASIGIVLIAFAVGYGTLNQKVEDSCKRIEKVEKESRETHDRVIEIDTKVEAILKSVERIEGKINGNKP